jgi:tetratricopeptide (TPR) repeat protein
MKSVLVILMSLSIATAARAQMEPDIQSRLEKIYRGDVESVREELPSLLSRYQNHPGVLYLQGMLTTDGPEAVKVFQSVVDNFPESEWADDALYRVYQYYYSVGLYRTAEEKLNQLKRDYPQSRYAFGQQPRFDRRDEIADERVESPAQPPARETRQPDTRPRPAAQYPFALQVGAFSTYENAMRQRDMLRDIDQPVEITTRMQGGQTLYLVWVGAFQSRDQAVNYGQQLRRQFNIETMIVSR